MSDRKVCLFCTVCEGRFMRTLKKSLYFCPICKKRGENNLLVGRTEYSIVTQCRDEEDEDNDTLRCASCGFEDIRRSFRPEDLPEEPLDGENFDPVCPKCGSINIVNLTEAGLHKEFNKSEDDTLSSSFPPDDDIVFS